MPELIQNVDRPELFFGFVAPIGANIDEAIQLLAEQLKAQDYTPVILKVTDVFKRIAEHANVPSDLKETPLEDRYESYIDYGDNLREHFADDSFLAACCIQQVFEARRSLKRDTPTATAYIIHQFKRKEEIELLRAVYGRLFFQVSVYSKRSSRVDSLARKIAISHYSADPNRYRDAAERLVRRDEHEIDDAHGQRVSEVFHEADFIVNSDQIGVTIGEQTERLVRLIFGANSISPTRMEYGLYTAKSASLRSLDLSRQVGAAIFSIRGEIITLGTNEVPKAGGGTYWCDDGVDNRDYARGEDSNDRRKQELLTEIVSKIVPESEVERVLSSPAIQKSQFMDALEYGRIIHAEMSAISDAARLGRATKNSILFCTTFPCHMCAKHIVAAGIRKVIYLEPYPKSLASELHGDAIEIEGQSRGEYSNYPAVTFTHFYGVSPKRYRDFFEKKRRKGANGKFQPWKDGAPKRPIIEINFPLHLQHEAHVIRNVLKPALAKAGMSLVALRYQSLPPKRTTMPKRKVAASQKGKSQR